MLVFSKWVVSIVIVIVSLAASVTAATRWLQAHSAVQAKAPPRDPICVITFQHYTSPVPSGKMSSPCDGIELIEADSDVPFAKLRIRIHKNF